MELVVRTLSKQYPHKLAVDRVSLTLTPGIYGLLGANGAGKTTLMRMLCGILHPTGGEISLDGLGVAQEEYRACLGYLPQDFGYYPGFTGEEFLWYMGALKGLPKAQARRRAKELLELVGLSQAAKGKIKTYSGGMKQRLGIAQALLGHPKLLVLDEPTAGLDPKERVRFRGLIASLGKQSIVLVSTHIVSDLAHIADVILDGGVIDNTFRAGTAIGTHMGVLVASSITLHALGNAVTQKSNSVKVAALHGAKGRQGGHAGIGVQVLQIYGLFHRGGCIPRGVIHGGKQALGVTRRLSGGFGLLRGCRGSSFRRGHGRFRLGGVRLLIVAGHPEKACSCTQYDQHHHQGNYRVAAAALFFYFLAVVVIISHRVIFSFYQQPRRAGGQKQQI